MIFHCEVGASKPSSHQERDFSGGVKTRMGSEGMKLGTGGNLLCQNSLERGWKTPEKQPATLTVLKREPKAFRMGDIQSMRKHTYLKVCIFFTHVPKTKRDFVLHYK